MSGLGGEGVRLDAVEVRPLRYREGGVELEGLLLGVHGAAVVLEEMEVWAVYEQIGAWLDALCVRRMGEL